MSAELEQGRIVLGVLKESNDALTAEVERLREALERIASEPWRGASHASAKVLIDIARSALAADTEPDEGGR